MALQASGEISLANIIAEFGGGTSLNDFYRGGGLVPNTPTNAGVPTSGEISINDFYGAANVTTVLTTRTVGASSASPADASIVYSTNADGYIYQSVNAGANTPLEQWLLSGAYTLYQVRATLVSGSLASGTLNTWQNPGAAWGVTRTLNTAGTTQAVITVEIRRVSDSVVVNTATITLQAVVEL